MSINSFTETTLNGLSTCPNAIFSCAAARDRTVLAPGQEMGLPVDIMTRLFMSRAGHFGYIEITNS